MTRHDTLHGWTFYEYLGCGTWAARGTATNGNPVEVSLSPDNDDCDPPVLGVTDLKDYRFQFRMHREVLFELVRRIGYDVTKRGES